ncbi:MAG: C40 family peptidase [Candidatus Pacebacteria bacterium]|nr:C40 family peptidase [Candidatus Paceibacterota bacterium]
MKYLHSWIQEYVEEKIPKGEDFVKVISTNAFEVEEYFEIENKTAEKEEDKKAEKTDWIYDLNVLPNRAHDALSHYYMAKEVATLFGFKMKERNLGEKNLENNFSVIKSDSDFVKIAAEANTGKSCTRFMGCKVNNILVKDSPEFIKYRLESIGQKSINNIVDITNYVQFSFNKPMHAYDADLISEFLEARFAKEGEVMTTLDNKELSLDEKTLVIADAKNVLGLAGIKGGKHSGISSTTKNIIVESANFNPVLIRKTSQKYNLKTDASKRFENELADELVEIGMVETLKLIKEYASDENTNIEIGEIVDNFPKEKLSKWKYKVSVSLKEINKILGTELKQKEVQNIFDRFGFSYKYISTKENIESVIRDVVGKKYKNPSSMREDAPDAFSCSSLVSYLYEGVYLPSISIDKYLYTKDLGKEIKDKEDLRFGDFIFINTGEIKTTGIYFEGKDYHKGEKVEKGIDHLAMYIGGDNILHSSSKLEKGTEVESLDKFLEKGKFVGYGRVLESIDEERFIITIPEERLDLRIKEDLIEEIARVYGLNNIKSEIPNLNRSGKLSKRMYFTNVVKTILFKAGFSEVYTYSLRNKGDIEIIKSVAQDKNFLRNKLSVGIEDAVQKNIFNIPLLNLSEIKIFEFGNCFSTDENGKEKEWLSLAIAIDDGKKNKNYTEIKNKILEEIKIALKIKDINILESKNEKQKENKFEINFDEIIKDLEEEYEFVNLEEIDLSEDVKYKSFSLMPFIVRDIAFWTGEEVNEEELERIIRENISDLCISVNLFDKFEKEIENIKKKSFGFRLIYQDKEKTLTDEEVNLEAEKVYNALKNKGFEIR